MDSAKNIRWIISFKKFGMVRVKMTGGFIIIKCVLCDDDKNTVEKLNIKKMH